MNAFFNSIVAVVLFLSYFIIESISEYCKLFCQKESLLTYLLIYLLTYLLSKAFDRVWHAGLPHKPRSYGTSGQIFGIISSFLSKRQLQVVLSGKSSQEYPVNTGVLQGSILCPTLFLLSYVPTLPFWMGDSRFERLSPVLPFDLEISCFKWSMSKFLIFCKKFKYVLQVALSFGVLTT